MSDETRKTLEALLGPSDPAPAEPLTALAMPNMDVRRAWFVRTMRAALAPHIDARALPYVQVFGVSLAWPEDDLTGQDAEGR